MKTSDNLDELTRALMAGTEERPSASLNGRIMAMLFRERRQRKVACRSGFSLWQWGMALWMLLCLVAGGVYLYLADPSVMPDSLVSYSKTSVLQVLLTVFSLVFAFSFFSLLGSFWQFNQEKKRAGF